MSTMTFDTATLDPDQLIAFTELMGKTQWKYMARRGDLVEAIRDVRITTGAGLKRTKDAVELWLKREREADNVEKLKDSLEREADNVEKLKAKLEHVLSILRARELLGDVHGYEVYRVGEVYEIVATRDSLEEAYHFIKAMGV